MSAHLIHFQGLQCGNEALRSSCVIHKQLHAILHVHQIETKLCELQATCHAKCLLGSALNSLFKLLTFQPPLTGDFESSLYKLNSLISILCFLNHTYNIFERCYLISL